MSNCPFVSASLSLLLCISVFVSVPVCISGFIFGSVSVCLSRCMQMPELDTEAAHSLIKTHSMYSRSTHVLRGSLLYLTDHRVKCPIRVLSTEASVHWIPKGARFFPNETKDKCTLKTTTLQP